MDTLKHDIIQLINETIGKMHIEIVTLKSEVNDLKHKVESLEKSNTILVKEKNFMILKEFSLKLKELIDNDEFDKFKELIESHEYPIDEYFYVEKSEYLEESNISSLNLLHYAIECDKLEFVYYLIGRGADVNVPDKIVSKNKNE